MPFNSFSYLAFLAVVTLVHAVLRARLRPVWPQVWLLAASLFFYQSAPTANPGVLLVSIVCNWALARWMMAQTDAAKRRRILYAGLALNITLLFLFKYINLFLGAIASLGGPAVRIPGWGFPLGVSFFTLIQIMYLVDAYPRPPAAPAARRLFRGMTEASSLFDHATLVTLFPYVVSGPLVSAKTTLQQLRKQCPEEGRAMMACRGLYLFSLGLAKKAVLADSFAPLADAGFSGATGLSTIESWIFCLSALLNLYFDFSGYSDMALGSAWMLGIDIPQNFQAPLRACSIGEFWQRWHISLSRFITEYLYSPMLRAFGRPSLATSMAATILAMTIAALWHGPAWTFVAWGVSHGAALAVNQAWKRTKRRMPDWLGWTLTMLFLTSTIVFLRAADLSAAWQMLNGLLPRENLTGIATLQKVTLISPTLILRPVGIGLLAAFLFKSSMQLAAAFKPGLRTALVSAILLLLSLIYMNSAASRQFIYFAF